MPIDHITQKNNNSLLFAFAKVNAEAARVLSERLFSKAYAQAFHQLHNQADVKDIAQEAFLNSVVWHQIGKRMVPKCQLGSVRLYKVSATTDGGASHKHHPRI